MKTKKVVCSVLVLLLILPVLLLSTGCGREPSMSLADVLSGTELYKLSEKIRNDFGSYRESDSVDGIRIDVKADTEEIADISNEKWETIREEYRKALNERFRLIDEKRTMREAGASEAELLQMQKRIDELETDAEAAKERGYSEMREEERALLEPYYKEFCAAHGLAAPAVGNAFDTKYRIFIKGEVSLATIVRLAQDPAVEMVRGYDDEFVLDPGFHIPVTDEVFTPDPNLTRAEKFDLSTLSAVTAEKISDSLRAYLDDCPADVKPDRISIHFRLPDGVDVDEMEDAAREAAKAEVRRLDEELDVLYDKKSALMTNGGDPENAAEIEEVRAEISRIFAQRQEYVGIYNAPVIDLGDEIWGEVIEGFAARHGLKTDATLDEDGYYWYIFSNSRCELCFPEGIDVPTLEKLLADDAVSYADTGVHMTGK